MILLLESGTMFNTFDRAANGIAGMCQRANAGQHAGQAVRVNDVRTKILRSEA